MKKCTTCKLDKSLDCFSSNGSVYIKSSCKSCRNDAERLRLKTNKLSYIKSKYSAMTDRAEGNSDHKSSSEGKPIISLSEFIEFSINNKKFNELHDLWVRSGFQADDSPSIDRIDNSKGYEAGNIQYITMRENRVKDRFKPVVITNGIEVMEFSSRRDAAEFLGVVSSGISDLYAGRRKKCKGWWVNAS